MVDPVEMDIDPLYTRTLEMIHAGELSESTILPPKYKQPYVNYIESKNTSSFPSRYVSDCSSVKNQIGGTCWAYGNNSLFESALLKRDLTVEGTTETISLMSNDSLVEPINIRIRNDNDLSVEHMIWGTFQERGEQYGFDSPYGGAGTLYSISYWLRTLHDNEIVRINGPATKEDWDSIIDEPSIVSTKKVPVANYYITNLSEVTNYNSKNAKVNDIKQKVMEDGAVVFGYGVCNNLYNSTKHTQYIDPSSAVGGHISIIVGWIDDFPLNYFYGAPSTGLEGAFIVKGSYGSSNGDSGFYYFSY